MADDMPGFPMNGIERGDATGSTLVRNALGNCSLSVFVSWALETWLQWSRERMCRTKRVENKSTHIALLNQGGSGTST